MSRAQISSLADTSYQWNTGGATSITFSQVSLNNWAAGGQNSSSVNSFLNLFADRRVNRYKWKNALQLGYGLQQLGDGAVEKTDDRLVATTSYGYQINKENEKWFFSVLVDFRTQFTPGFSLDDPDSVISRFMAPGYLTVGTGIEYAPNEFIEISYKPLTGKITFVTDDRIVGEEGAYGVRPGRNVRGELGSYFLMAYKQDPIENVTLESRLELFTNYEKENAGNIDVNWQNTVIMQINKYLTTNLFTHLIYDDDINTEKELPSGEIVSRGPKIQFKSVFGVGLTYKFGNQRINPDQ